jgi:glycosyltransferase involved in cell wall biosynthesis
MTPVVSVLITTRNRRAIVEKAVESILAQENVHVTVHVYDDCSSDDTFQHVRTHFRQVHIVRASRHSERLVLRNTGMRTITSDFVLMLDDDCYFTDPMTLRTAMDVFSAIHHTAVVCIPLVEPFRKRPDNYAWCTARRGDLMGSFLAGASIFRREAYWQVGGYCEQLVHHHEESDLGIRLLDAGWRFVYAGGVPLVHTLDMQRVRTRQVRWYARNAIVVPYLNYPSYYCLRHILGSAYCMVFRAFGDVPVGQKIGGIFDGLRECARVRAMRHPVRTSTYRLWRNLPKHGPERPNREASQYSPLRQPLSLTGSECEAVRAN